MPTPSDLHFCDNLNGAVYPAKDLSTILLGSKVLKMLAMRLTSLRTLRSVRCLTTTSSLLRQSVYDYSKVSDLVSQPRSSSKILIDVREPQEYEGGNIPTSINLPLSSLEKTLALDNAAFEEVTGLKKPGKDEEVIFYCKAGVRSTSASNIAEKLGYKEIGNYKGSYAEWSEKSSSRSSSSESASFSGKSGKLGTPSGGDALGARQYSTSTTGKKSPNPNQDSGEGEGAKGGIDLKAMNQKEEKRAEPAKQAEKKGDKPLASAKEGGKESESVRSGAELSTDK